jgi:hypothetical protein
VEIPLYTSPRVTIPAGILGHPLPFLFSLVFDACQPQHLHTHRHIWKSSFFKRETKGEHTGLFKQEKRYTHRIGASQQRTQTMRDNVTAGYICHATEREETRREGGNLS